MHFHLESKSMVLFLLIQEYSMLAYLQMLDTLLLQTIGFVC